MLSRLVMLVSQSLEQASSVATRSDLAMSV
jgi:hypothetical protein